MWCLFCANRLQLPTYHSLQPRAKLRLQHACSCSKHADGSHCFIDSAAISPGASPHATHHVCVCKCVCACFAGLLGQVDIESSEWALFDWLCSGAGSAEALPFDQLLIELHTVNATRLGNLVACLDRHGLYPFAREENIHDQACSWQPPAFMDLVEMSFVRANSRFTAAPQQQVSPLWADGVSDEGEGGDEGDRGGGGSGGAGAVPPRSGLGLRPPLGANEHPAEAAALAAATTAAAASARRQEPMRRQVQLRDDEARARRAAYVAGGRNVIHNVGFGDGWPNLEAWRCAKGPHYLWDLFEPRGW